jgi:PKD repeat protein
VKFTRRTLVICLLALVPVLAGGAVGALAGGVLPGSDLVTTVPTTTVVKPSQRPVINTVAGVGAVGLEGGTPFAGVRRPQGALVAGPPQEKGDTHLGPQLVSADGTITAIWSSPDTGVLHAARLAPGATSWVAVNDVPKASIGSTGAVIAADGSITALTYDNESATKTIVSRRLPAGASSWEPSVTIEQLAAGSSIVGEPTIAISPVGVVMAGWEENTIANRKVGGALQAANGTWPNAGRELIGDSEFDLGLGAIAVPDSGRSGRLIINDFEKHETPEVKVVPRQFTDAGTIPMASVPAPSQGSGYYIATAAAFTPDGTLRIFGQREGGISESDVPTTNNGQFPGDPYPIAEFNRGSGPVAATLPDGEMLLSYAAENEVNKTQTVDLLRRPVGAAWSEPLRLQPPISADDGGIDLGGIAVDSGGDAYITWSTLDESVKAALAGAVLDNSPPVIDGLTLPSAVAGQSVQLGVTAHDTWSPTTARWDFGDGSTAEGDSPTHTFATAGAHTVTVTVTDAAGNQATSTGTVNVGEAQKNSPPPPPPPSPKDTTKPKLAIAQPTCAKKLSPAECRKRRAASSSWHTVRGTVSDAGGIASVTLQATSGTGKNCTVLVSGGKSKAAPCAKAAKLKATLSGGRWTVKTPGIAEGTWKLSVIATDKSGNATTARLTLHLTS